jgi:diguanylate cyclase (GGDEF)-like protein
VRDRSSDAAREAELLRRADRDGLTGLLNKRSFGARLAEETARLGARGRPLGLVVVDLDRFKAVNDEHGHPVGDRVLAEAARRIAAEARAIDSVGRIGGEEFAWLLPDASAEETLLAAERARAAVAARPPARGRPADHRVGRRVRPRGGRRRPREAHGARDQALYWAKAHGRDTALRWSPAAAARWSAPARSAGRPTSASPRWPAWRTRPTRAPAAGTGAGSPT